MDLLTDAVDTNKKQSPRPASVQTAGDDELDLGVTPGLKRTGFAHTPRVGALQDLLDASRAQVAGNLSSNNCAKLSRGGHCSRLVVGRRRVEDPRVRITEDAVIEDGWVPNPCRKGQGRGRGRSSGRSRMAIIASAGA